LAGKWLELLSEAAPKISRVAVLAVSQTPAHHTFWTEIQVAAKALKMTTEREEIAGPDAIEDAFVSFIKGRAQGLIVLPHAVTFTYRTQIVSLSGEEPATGDVFG
jgi:hypothetical protein